MPLSRSAFASAAVLVLVLTAACGGDDPARPRAAPSPASVPPSPSTTPSATSTPTSTADPTPAPEPAEPDPTSAPDGGRVELFGDGVDLPNRVVAFGDPLEQVEEVIVGALGEPTRDTGVISPFSEYGTCTGEALRVLEFSGGALLLLFGDGEQPGGPLTLFAWQLTEDGATATAPRARALVGDVSTYEFGVGVSVPELQDGLGETLELVEAEGPFPPGFRVEDQSSGLFGTVTGTGPDGAVTGVVGGSPCGE